MNLNSVRIALVPALQYASFGELTNVGVNRVSNLESKVFSNACLETFLEGFMVEVTPDGHEAAFTHFVFFLKTNVFLEITTEKHVNALEHVLCVHALHREDALVPEQVFALFSHEFTNPSLQFVDVEFTDKFGAR